MLTIFQYKNLQTVGAYTLECNKKHESQWAQLKGVGKLCTYATMKNVKYELNQIISFASDGWLKIQDLKKKLYLFA